ncbi:MAG: hypothetical protein RJA70_1888 [Pseudomonadota bacterium]|jgi:hypothetical protein
MTGYFSQGSLLLIALATGCAGDGGHPPFITDTSGAEAECDAGACAGQGMQLAPPDRSLKCLDEETLKEFTEPLLGTVERFDSDYFHPLETAAVEGAYEVKTLGARTNTLACASSPGGQPFALLGGTEREGGFGPLLLLPDGHKNFWPTMIQKAPTRDADLGRVPVFGPAQMNKIFKDTGVKPDPTKGHIVVEFTFVDETMQRTRFSGIKLSAAAASAVAYRVGSTWTTDATETDSNGLGVLLNVGASDEGLGMALDAHYVFPGGSGDKKSHPIENVWVFSGAVTYVAQTPEG